jgi:hypothetical protein
LLGAILHLNSSPLADIFIVGALVGVLKSPPTADVIDQNGLKLGTA